MSTQHENTSPQPGHERSQSRPAGAAPTEEETTLRARVAEQAAQLKKINADLLRAHAELVRAKELSWQNAQYLQAVLNNSPAAIGYVKAVFNNPQPLQGDILTDRVLDYRLVALNDKFAMLVGEPVGELVGQSASRVAGILWFDDTYASFRRVIAEDAVLFEERESVEDGQPRWHSLSAVKHDGGVVLTSLDITELRQTQLQREALRQQAKRSQQVTAQLATLRQQLRDRGTSLRATSHDLRSSMGIVQGAAQLLNLTESDSDRVQLLDMINRNVSEMTRLLVELVELSPIEEERPPKP